MTLKAILYDLDGTLVDSRDDLADSVNAMLSRLALPTHPPRTIFGFIGEGAERLIRRALGEHQDRYAEAAPVWREEYARRLLAKTRAYEGIPQVVSARFARQAVLTNKPGSFAREILQGLDLAPHFEAVIGGDEAPRKPAPDGLLRLVERLGASEKTSLLVGDSTVDLETARAAGVPFCAVTWGLGAHADLGGAEHVCHTPGELSALLKRLTGS